MDILITVLLGLLIVFVGLLLICGMILLMPKLLQKIADRTKKTESNPDEKPEENTADRDELIAILTAAVAAYTPEQEGHFRVVSFRRRGDR